MIILYGIFENTIDVTEICYNKLLRKNIITIPNGDEIKQYLFKDPAPGIVKKIFVVNDGKLTVYNDNLIIKINIINNTISTIDATITTNEVDNFKKKLKKIQENLQIKYGTFMDEYSEQLMCTRYLTGCENVLEIGGNIGRNSLIIASILKENNGKLVTLESDINIASKLCENRDINKFTFPVEKSALSKKKLIQKEWVTIPSESLLDGYKWVNTITLEELEIKYNVKFDTLVLDCEGAFYYILMDMPEILDNIKLIIVENDYDNIEKKNYVDEVLTSHGFYVHYQELYQGYPGPCYSCFYEAWKK
jgi:FkbM family methyltransferase